MRRPLDDRLVTLQMAALLHGVGGPEPSGFAGGLTVFPHPCGLHSSESVASRQWKQSAGRVIIAAMAYDGELADRIREVLAGEPDLSEKSMFGGLAFLIADKIAVSASNQGGLLVRIDPTMTDFLVSEPHIRRFEMRRREMDGWLRVDAEVLKTDEELRRWVSHAVTYARSLLSK